MTQRVKEFIEDYIDDIEKNNWELVFDSWYQETTSNYFWEDGEQFKELLSVLTVLDIDTEALTSVRAKIIEKYTEDVVNTIQHNNYNRIGSYNIYWRDVIQKLESLLGFSKQDIFDLIFNEMDIAGVTPDHNKERFVVEGL